MSKKKILLGIFNMIFFPSANRYNKNVFMLCMVIFPIALIFYSDYVGRYFFVPRQVVWTIPFWAIAVGMSTDALN